MLSTKANENPNSQDEINEKVAPEGDDEKQKPDEELGSGTGEVVNKNEEEEKNKLEELRKAWFNSSLRSTLATVGAGGAFVAREALSSYASVISNREYWARYYYFAQDIFQKGLPATSIEVQNLLQNANTGEVALLVTGVALAGYAVYETYKSYKAEKEFKKEKLVQLHEFSDTAEMTTEELEMVQAKEDWYGNRIKAVVAAGSSGVALIAKKYLSEIAHSTWWQAEKQARLLDDLRYHDKELPAEVIQKFYALCEKVQYAETGAAAALAAAVALAGYSAYSAYRAFKAKEELNPKPEQEPEPEPKPETKPKSEPKSELVALSCPACGAPVSSADSVCPYCQSGLERK
ncbi:zinc ribbon domain-containing protein [candidate division WWE3 bacterium]|jgi:hypothetical protein|uniref:Zinc ribbon domain-containing protein n=1 Tax=candidate division WWE3 bacterium TaxID=2053526 RepID=A0A3A4ZKL7_UNCKA|nr:MAG: zinc ribbon domain-containing protein [candidate division WWE3 bacterium]